MFCYRGSAQDLVHLSTTEVKLSEAMTFCHISHMSEAIEFDDRDPQITGCSES